MKRFFILTVLILISTLTCRTQVVNLNPDPNGVPWLTGGVPLLTPELQEIIDRIPKMIRQSFITPQDVVDNSSHKFMRPIFNQTNGSCAQASGVAYVFTYEINWLRDLAANSTELDENQYPTHFTYNFLNSGNGNNVSVVTDGWELIKQIGCPSIETYGGLCVNNDPTYWMTGYNKYKMALNNRVDFYNTIDLSNPEEGLTNLKQWLYNHNNDEEQYGGLASFTTNMQACDFRAIQTSYQQGKFYLYEYSNPQGENHQLTIVGFDDNICLWDINGDGEYTTNIDVNNDQVINLLDFEKGAFKVANSWGNLWPNEQSGGFVYWPYKFLAYVGENYPHPFISLNAFIVYPLASYEPELVLKSNIYHEKRNSIRFDVDFGETANDDSPVVGHGNYSAFSFRGGNYPILGSQNYDPLEVTLDYNYFFSNQDVGKLYFNVWQGDNSSFGYISQFSLVDYRWGENFELDSQVSYDEFEYSYNWHSIEYDLIPHEQPINTVLSFNSNMVSRFSPRVTNHSTLTIGVDKGVRVDMYQSELIIEEGSSLVVGNGCDFYAKRGPSKISINGNITIGTGVSFASGDLNSTLELNFNNPGQTVYINDCDFSKCNIKSASPLVFNNCVFNYTTISSHSDFVATNSLFNYSSVNETMDDIEVTGSTFDHSSIIASNPSIGSIPINNTAIITSNGFTTAHSDAGSVIEVYGYRNYNISENMINTVGSPANTSHGIAIHYSGTTDARNLHTISNNTIYCSESNCTHSISGITIYSSVADITERNYIYQNFIGIQCLGNSQVKLMGDPSATTVSNAQRIINNRRVQLYASQNAFPTQTDHNVIFSAITNDCYVRHDVSALINPPKVDVVNNYWGTSFNQAVNLCPAGHYYYEPEWVLTPIQLERSSVQQLYATADSLVADSNYTAAKSTFQQLVTIYPEKEQAISALKAVLYLEPLAGNNFEELKQWYLNEPAILDNEILLKLSDNLANKCNEKLESYQDAITWYENVIQNPETLEDSIFAIIDLEHLYWQMGIDTTLRSTSYVGSMTQYKPKSFQSFKDQKDELLRLLYGDRKQTVEPKLTFDEKGALNQGYLLQNMPNPFSCKTTIQFNLTTNEAVPIAIKIFDRLGKMVKQIDIQQAKAGLNSIDIDMQTLLTGMYYYSLFINGQQTDSKKMVVVR